MWSRFNSPSRPCSLNHCSTSVPATPHIPPPWFFASFFLDGEPPLVVLHTFTMNNHILRLCDTCTQVDLLELILCLLSVNGNNRYSLRLKYWLVVTTVSSQLPDSVLKSQLGGFLSTVYMSSPCLHKFTLATSASIHSPKMHIVFIFCLCNKFGLFCESRSHKMPNTYWFKTMGCNATSRTNASGGECFHIYTVYMIIRISLGSNIG